MKNYSMIIFYVLMSILLVFSLTMQAEERKEGDAMESQEGKHMMRKPGGTMRHHDWLSSSNLDEDVLKKIQEMKSKNKEKILDLKNQIEKKELEMEKVLLDKKPDFNKVLSIHDEIAALRQRISRRNLEHKIEVYKLLPDDKKEKARKIFLHRFLRKGHRETGMPGKIGDSECPRGK